MISTVGIIASGFLVVYKIVGKGKYSWLMACTPGLIGVGIDMMFAITAIVSIISILV